MLLLLSFGFGKKKPFKIKVAKLRCDWSITGQGRGLAGLEFLIFMSIFVSQAWEITVVILSVNFIWDVWYYRLETSVGIIQTGNRKTTCA